MGILGISDASVCGGAALYEDGRVSWAIDEERLNRRKLATGFPALSIAVVLQNAGLTPAAPSSVSRPSATERSSNAATGKQDVRAAEMGRVQVTGGSGLLGGHLVAALHERGHGVLSLVRSDDGALKPAAVERVLGDVLDAPRRRGHGLRDPQVLDEATAFLCPPQGRALGETLAQALADPQGAPARGACARERAEREYSFAAFQSKLLGAYQQILSGRARVTLAAR